MAETFESLRTHLQTVYDFRKNTVTGKLEFRSAGTNQQFERLDTYKLNSILWQLKADNYQLSKTELASLLDSEFSPRVDVFKEYFEGLPPVSDDVDNISALAETVTTNNQELWRYCLKKWLVGVVACAINPKKSNHQVLVLVGAQGIGKTTWLNKLLPSSLNGYLYGGFINPNNKDTLTMLSENLFVNLDELGSFRNGDLEKLKELISKTDIQVRRPYAEYAENFHRRASLMGAVNNFSFLSDTTGNRRFLPFSVSHVNYSHAINMDSVYRQAYDNYINGSVKYWFDLDDIESMKEHIEQYEDKSIEEQLIETNLEPCTEADYTDIQTTTEIAQGFAKDGLRLTNASVQRIGATLRRKGFKRVKYKGVYMYLVKAKSIN